MTNARQCVLSNDPENIYLSSLFTKSPNPGVSTTLSLNLTPFSSISAVIDWMSTVFGDSCEGSATTLLGYNSVLNKVFTKVDLPKPDSPKSDCQLSKR